MGRSGYIDDWDPEMNLYRGAVEQALYGNRGQAFLRELIAALDAMPVKELIQGDLVQTDEQGKPCYCALGAVYAARGTSLEGIASVDVYDWETLASELNIAESMAREIMWWNDEGGAFILKGGENTDANRWKRMRDWAEGQLADAKRYHDRIAARRSRAALALVKP